MKITKKWLNDHDACEEGIEWWESKKFKTIEVLKLCEILMDEKHFKWAEWLLLRSLSRINLLKYGCYAIELVLPIFEKEYPDDKRPRNAINAVKKYLENPTQKNKNLVRICGDVARAADYAARAADVPRAADYVARAADVEADDYAAARAADYATAYASYASQQIRGKIVNYGIKLLKEEK